MISLLLPFLLKLHSLNNHNCFKCHQNNIKCKNLTKPITASKFFVVCLICIPHDVDAEMSTELDEELNHLAKISGIAMGIEKRESRKRVSPERGNNFVAGLCGELVDFHVLVRRRHAGEDQVPGLFILGYAVCCWLRREKGELSRHI